MPAVERTVSGIQIDEADRSAAASASGEPTSGSVLPDGTVQRGWLKLNSNGLALSADERTLYVVNRAHEPYYAPILDGEAKDNLVIQPSNRGTAPATRTAAGMSANATDTSGKYVQSVEVTNGTILVTYGGTEVNSQLAGQTLEIVPYVTVDRSVAWRCGGAPVPANTTLMSGAAYSGGTLAGADYVKYLPSACRP